MPILIFCQSFNQSVALVTGATAFLAKGTGVSLINYDKLGTGANKIISAPVRLDEVHGYDDVIVNLE